MGDEAAWIVGQVNQQFGSRGSYLVDFFHLSEYLAAAAPCCSTDADAWLELRQEELKANRTTKELEALLPYRESPSTPDEHAPVRKKPTATSATASAKWITPEPSKKKRPIGSDEIESAQRFVVHTRLKKQGGWWKVENVDPMLALRVTRLNGGWKSYWKSFSDREAA